MEHQAEYDAMGGEMKKRDVEKLPHGIYRIYWKDGGSSVAAVGSLSDGERWIAPTNWINVPDYGRGVWRKVKSVHLIATQREE